ncbi:2-phosphosulfolactate phosphatase [Ktedonospora formicarum]|uniref:Uncharacterized protein n=1 Tax=Ktedonospora formicarum TaxID=2778364 RepID=A0A8J3HU27_9CHLR|nr:2-phosphosulfolactate phosphatase [Ktedonospora formicarum]GHO43739.1 hypothetical protein KSX_19020 [Ktedonospora formicarum]
MNIVPRSESEKPEESAHAALALYEAFPSTRLLKYCYAAHAVSSAGLTEDLELCMQVNRSQAIPHVTGQDC